MEIREETEIRGKTEKKTEKNQSVKQEGRSFFQNGDDTLKKIEGCEGDLTFQTPRGGVSKKKKREKRGRRVVLQGKRGGNDFAWPRGGEVKRGNTTKEPAD